MLCEACHQAPATVHLTLTLAETGTQMKVNFCEPCAQSKGVHDPSSLPAQRRARELGQTNRPAMSERVRQAVASTPVIDIHTHLYDPAFGELLLWGIDDLLTYHYLVAEVFRYLDLPYERFWRLSKAQQADLIWKTLFLEHSPVSEACRGVVTTLQRLGLDPKQRDLSAIRKWFGQWKVEKYVDHCLELAGAKAICMTNSPFDEVERPVWERGFKRDERFVAGLRIDPLLLAWPATAGKLQEWGYDAGAEFSAKTVSEVRRFLAAWTDRIRPKYLMVSLAPEFAFPDQSDCTRLIEKAVLPHCREFGLPLALMMGVNRAQNANLKLAGDGMGSSNLAALAHLCAEYPENRFLVTVLARENQHELCVLGRKFRNLHVFGCWWFMNVPYVVNEMTRMRVELLGLSFTPQHSDARILDQIIYKWQHSRRIIADVLIEKYAALAEASWEPTQAEIERDVTHLFGGAFEQFCQP